MNPAEEPLQDGLGVAAVTPQPGGGVPGEEADEEEELNRTNEYEKNEPVFRLDFRRRTVRRGEVHV